MPIYCVTHRYYNARPHDCSSNIVGYYSTIEKARTAVQELLGDEATCDRTFGFDIWVSPYLPNTEYRIDIIQVW